MKKRLISLAVLAALFSIPSIAHDAKETKGPLPLTNDINQKVENLLNQMTLHEKVMQVLDGDALNMQEATDRIKGGTFGTFRAMGLSACDCAQLYADIYDLIKKNDRLHIPMITCAEGIEGLIQNECTVMPHALAQGSTFNPALVEQMTDACGAEAEAIGIHQILSPVLDVARELRWGRVEETFGEDPYLISQMGTAFVKGYQYHPVTCTIKHFIAHGTPTRGVNYSTVSGGELDLHNLYLYPFRKVLENAHPLSVMSCYSAYDNVPVTGSHYYMTDVLRGELGFNGYTYSDWGSVEMLKNGYKLVKTDEEAAIKGISAGIDLDVGGSYWTLEQSVKDGKISEDILNEAVRRILRVKYRLGLFDCPRPDPKKAKKVVHSADKVEIAKKVAEESIILLENKNNILPLDRSKVRNIAVLGCNSAKTVIGDYSWVGSNMDCGVSLYEGIKNLAGKDITVSQADGCDWWSQDKSHFDEALSLARQSDVIVYAVGTRSYYLGREHKYPTAGEGFDLSSLDLPGVQVELFHELKKLGKPIIVTLISGKPMVMGWAKDEADGILVQWYGGEQQGTALAEVIFGDVNPSGRLNVSFPRSTGNTPCYYNRHRIDNREEGDGEWEAANYVMDTPKAMWYFGYGKSYTDFDYVSCDFGNDSVFTENDTLTVNVKIKNTGKRDGKEVAQLYISHLYSSISTPLQELKAFSKQMVKAGEEQTFTLRMPINELRLYTERHRYELEPGEVEIQVGAASDDISFRKSIYIK